MGTIRDKSNKKFMLLSAIGIFMVVDSHTWTAFNLFGDFIPYNSFFMPMFVFISGYFNKVDNDTGLGRYILKKAKTLLLPYAGLSLLVFCLQWLINLIKLGESVPPPPGYLMYVLQNVVTTGVSLNLCLPMWFVISLFALLVAYAVLKKFLYKVWNRYVMLLLFTGLHIFAVFAGKYADPDFIAPLLTLLKCMFFLPFLELGMLYRDKIEAKHSSMGGGAKIGLMAILLFINTIRSLYLPMAYDMAFDSLDDLSGFTSPYLVTPLVSSLIGIAFWLTLVDLAGKPLYESRFINYMSCNTFWIMGLHITFFNILNLILMGINENIAELPYFDTEYFLESEWYRWEMHPNFKMVYVLFGILGPLGLKLLWDKCKEKVTHRT